MIEEKLLEKAYKLCLEKHAGQTDKVGKPYFMHPFRVAERCVSIPEKIVALLHDTIEDTDVTPDMLLAEGFPREIIEGILAVTRKEGEDYFAFIERAAKNPLGKIVKIHDLEDNMDIRRLESIDDRMRERLNRYIRSYHYLTSGSHLPKEDTSVKNPLTTKERARRDRQEAETFLNQKVKLDYKAGNSEFNKDRLSVNWKYKETICRPNTVDTFIEVLERIGLSEVAKLEILHSRKPIVSQEKESYRHKRTDKGGWYVYSPNAKDAAHIVNQIADSLDLPLVATCVPKISSLPINPNRVGL